MSLQKTDFPTVTRRPARDIIEAVLDNMRKNLEPLRYSTLAPSRYTVYLHANEYARLEGIVPILKEQTVRALTDELESLNRRSSLRRQVDRLRRRSEPEDRSAGADWQTNAATQISWGLGYIAGRYGSPCGAWSHSESVGWY